MNYRGSLLLTCDHCFARPTPLICRHLAGFVEEMDLCRLRPARSPIRTSLEGIEELVASIQEKGLLNPILVRPIETGYEIIAGNRRHAACKILHWTKIPCHVVDVDDKTAFELALMENIQHETLSPLEMARSFKKYVDEFGYGGVTELARKIGKSEQYVSQYLQILKLPEDILEKVSTRVVTISQARELAGLATPDQRVLAEEIVRGNLSSRDVRRIVSQMKTVHEGEDDDKQLHRYSESAKAIQRLQGIERTLNKCIASLKASMLRFDDIIDQTDENEWILRETLADHRRQLHRQIDSLIKLRRRVSLTQF
jgi:ParB family chromosome partitioning protein